MKTNLALILSVSLAGSALAQTPPAPAPAPAPAAPAAPAAPKTDDERPAGLAAALAAEAAAKAAEAARPPTPAVPKEPVKRITSDTEKGMRLNFRGVPLEQVLNYFGEVTGYIIVPKVSDIRGRVDVWSEDPLTKDEAISVLNNALSRNGYAAFLSGRSLNVVNKDEMSRQPLPVKPGSDPEQIPATENMVTQIIPIKFISAEQVIKNFDSLLPTSSIMTANAGANALVITDTQINIKRVAEIIKALDTPVASVSAIRVFTLKYADAKALATVVKDLFATDSRGGTGGQQGGVDPRQQLFQRFGGGGGSPFGGGGTSGGRGGSAASGGRVTTPKVVASADELSNSLIVSAPEDSMTMIEEVVKQVDVPVEDVTEIKVFRLKYASADDTATMLKNLFPDTSTQGNRGGGNRTGSFFGGFRPPGSTGGGTSAGAGQSERALKQNKVVAVADNRTTSVIVTASPTLMEQITGMIAQLDSDPSKQQKVFVIPVENADPAQMQQILQALFPTQSGRTAQSSGTRTGTGGFGTGTTTRNNGGQSGTSGRTGSSTGFGGGGNSSGFGGSGGSSGGGFGGGR
ncbi:MAG: secretin N-terminal domain-containing protein [Limisphaerales bacterium]